MDVMTSNSTQSTELSKEGLNSSMIGKYIKEGIWIYFLLLIFEGALRKWFLPGLAGPLLIIRDPLALWLIFITWRRGLLPANFYLMAMVVIGVAGIFTGVLLGHGNIAVAIFGARTLLLHFPLMFVIGSVFDRDDVIKLGKVTLWIAIPMAVLIALQFYSPQTAWVNRGVGGDMEGAGFAGALEFMRPPATFSFTNGTTLFFSFTGLYVIYFWFHPKEISPLILLGATAALIVSIPLSISRSLLFQIGLSLIFAMIAISRNPKYLGKMIFAAVGGIVAFAVLSQTSFFQTATGAFSDRFETANEVEGGLEGVLIDRFLGGMVSALSESTDLPFFGYGLGMGTNVGSVLLTGGTQFLIAEGEWGRVIGEMGLLLGLGIIVIRLALTYRIALSSLKKLSDGDFLPWMILSFGALLLTQGGWAQPTSLGFCTLVGGLMIASFRRNYSNQS